MVLVAKHSMLNNTITIVKALPKEKAIELVNKKNMEIHSMLYGILDMNDLKNVLEEVTDGV